MYNDVHRKTDRTTHVVCQFDAMDSDAELSRDHVSLITPQQFYRLSRSSVSGVSTAKIVVAGFDEASPVISTNELPIVNSRDELGTLIGHLKRQGYQIRQSQDVHACLVNIHGLGVLITGAPGVGKSRLVWQLLGHGHVLIADDVVELEPTPDGIVGVAPLTIFGLLQIRGQDVREIRRDFGESALRLESRIALNIHIGKDNVLKMQKIAGIGPPRWYIAAPESHLVYQCLEDYRLEAGINWSGL